MSGGVRYPRAVAEKVITDIVNDLGPWTERYDIAGSYRRGKADVGDVEMVYIPKYRNRVTDLFGAIEQVDLLGEWLEENMLSPGAMFSLRMNSAGRKIGFGPLNKMLVHNATNVPVDIFTTSAANWGMAMVVRTGPADLNIHIMRAFLAKGMKGHAYGGVTRRGLDMPMPTEEDVFKALGWSYRVPQDRDALLAELQGGRS